jgi:hypothetical protein
MKTKKSSGDSMGAYKRKAINQRRVGEGARCACGESRPEALIAGTDPITCHECQRKQSGQANEDAHHVAGQANGPETLSTPVNDHRAELTPAQQRWPDDTLRNPSGCPLRRGAAYVRGVIDYLRYLINKVLGWVPEMLESASQLLGTMLGPNWWVGTPLECFAPEQGA